MNKRSQFAWRIVLACLAGLVMSGICLYVGLPHTATLLQWRQEMTRQRFEGIEEELASYRALHHVYPQSLSQIPDDSGSVAKDEWYHPIPYTNQGNSYLLISYGADGKPGGVGLNCDLTNLDPNPPQAEPSFQVTWASPLSGGLKGGAMYSGLLTAFLAFRSLNLSDSTRRAKSKFALKMSLTLVAALLVSLFITFADIPLVGH